MGARAGIPSMYVRRIVLGLVACIFLAPIAGAIFGEDAIRERENRRPAPMPPFPDSFHSLASFPAAFESYFKDYFGFRGSLIDLSVWGRYHILKTSPSKKVVIGNDGWLYFYYDEGDARRAPHLYSEKTMRQLLDRFRRRAQWFARQGITFLSVIAPNKQTIYPEFLPATQRSWAGINRYRQFASRVAIDQTLKNTFIDLYPRLMQRKGKGRLIYYKTDSHWNDLGAFAAYREILQRIRETHPEVGPPLEVRDVVSGTREFSGDLLKDQIALPNFPLESAPYLAARQQAPYAEQVFEGRFGRIPLVNPLIVHTQPGGTDLKVVVIRDSQFLAVMPFFSPHFRRVVYVHHAEEDRALDCVIERERPDIVLHESVERSLGRMLSLEPPAAPCTY